jgi:hypothetical protein
MRRCREELKCGSIIFVGMDCPELSSTEVRRALERSVSPSRAYVCPARDGGYVMLALPTDTDARLAFGRVRWSSHDTCESQMEALQAMGLTVLQGKLAPSAPVARTRPECGETAGSMCSSVRHASTSQAVCLMMWMTLMACSI